MKKIIHHRMIMISIDIQRATSSPDLPGNVQIRNWVKNTLKNVQQDNIKMTVRIVDEKEGKDLNEHWRSSKGPTNVLSFPSTDTEQYIPGFIGDIILCAPVIIREATEQNKTLESHWAHIIIHGTLHLLGYDHNNDREAKKMESLEIRILASMGFRDPYHIHETI